MRINARAVMVLPWCVLVALTARPGAFRTFYQSSGGVVDARDRRNADRWSASWCWGGSAASRSKPRPFASAGAP